METRFVEDDGHGAMTVAVPAERTAPGIWRASFALPRTGRWEGVHEYRVQTPAGRTLIRSTPFALRVVRPGG
ncbi:MAG TPA: hypothetical protein VG370_11280 [Chloroflexota bacterium]|nr:hypothetical protein [Chloroflexota bacterium]